MNKTGKVTREKDGYQVVFNRTLNHPIDKVWDAITNPEQLKYWFTDIEMDFREGGKITIRFRDKDKTSSYGEIVHIDPPHKFAWTWEGELAVWELKEVDERTTQLTFTYSKLSKEYAINAPAGFHTLLDRLESRLNGNDVLHLFGTEENDPEHIRMKVHYASAVYEDYPDIVPGKPVVAEKVYDAPLERVWRALTDVDQMKQWYFDLDEFRLEVGFRFSFAGQGHKGAQYIHICTITDFIPKQKLQYSWTYKDHPGYSLVTFQLSQSGNKTRLVLTHHGLETFPQDNPDFAPGSFNQGWTHIVGVGLAEFLAKG